MTFQTAQYIRAWFGSRNDEGATMVEYGLMVALIAVVVAVGAATLGTNILNIFNTSASDVGGTTPTTAAP